MAAVNHPEYSEELVRCNFTLQYVNKSLDVISGKKDRLDKEVTRLKKHFNSESSQDYVDLNIKMNILRDFRS